MTMLTDAGFDAFALAELRDIVGEFGLVTGADASMRSCDPFRHVPPQCPIIVRPRSTAEVSQVLAHCHARGQRVVIHGGRTGVAGGAYADNKEIVVSLERMTRVDEIDPIGQTATVEAGITVQALQDAVATHELCYPVDLGSKGSATIGGTIATNAGGNHVVRWGTTRHNVLGLEAVLADGTVVSMMNRLVKNNTGYDLKQLLIGSEGTLALVTRAVLRLVPRPTTQYVALLALRDFEAVLALLIRARRLPSLSAFEVMWHDFYALMANSGSNRRPLPPQYAFYVLVESQGYHEHMDAAMFESFLEAAQDAGLLADAVTSASGKQAAELWRVREGSEIIARDMSPFVSFDVSIDVRRAADFTSEALTSLEQLFTSVQTVSFGHLGDANLHLGVHIGPDTLTRQSDIERCVYAVVKKFAGALTAEHGIGQFKREFLPHHVERGTLDVMRRVRATLDPNRLLNRNVLF